MKDGVLEPGRVSAPRLTRGDLWGVFARSFFLQTLWNFQRMQNIGWLFGFWPVLRRLYPSAEERRARAREHLEYFNTHPYLADLILGVAAGLEEDAAAGRGIRPEQVLASKKAMSGPLAALGDTLFWATLRPSAGLAAALFGWLAAPDTWWAAPAAFLIGYNTVHLAARAGGLAAGYRLKAQVAPFLLRFNLQKAVRAAHLAAGAAAAAGLAALVWNFGPGAATAAVFAAASLAILRAGLSSTQAFYAAMTGLAAWVFLNP